VHAVLRDDLGEVAVEMQEEVDEPVNEFHEGSGRGHAVMARQRDQF
jgi:hypothetical protein